MLYIKKNSIRNLFTKFHSSFFWRFLSSYILLFLIPFCTTLITYNYAAHSIEKSILHSNSNILYQFFSNVDAVFSEMSVIGKTLANSSIVQQYAFHSSLDMATPSIDAYYLNQSINSFRQKDFENICVYFPGFSKVFNGSNGLTLEDYYQTYYKDMTSEEDFKNFMTRSIVNYKIDIRSINNDVANPLLGVIFSQPVSRGFHGAPGITAIITLSQNALHQLFADSSVHSDGILMIFDGNNKLLASSHPISNDIISVYDGTKDVYYETYQGEKYVLQFFPSQVSDCTYASAIPVNIFWDQLSNLQLTSLICVFLCILLSSFLAWKMAKMNYSPITGMLYTITQNTGTIYDCKKNDMNFISDVLTNSLHKITSLNRKLENQENTLRNNFLMQAMLGNLIEDSLGSEENLFSKHQITLHSHTFGIISIYIEAVSDIQNPQILQFIIANVTQELCAAVKHQGYLVPIEVNSYACIINFAKALDEENCLHEMQNIARHCATFLKEHFTMTTTMCISGVHHNLSGIHLCYLDAQKAFTYRFCYGKGSTILYNDLQEKCFDFTGIEAHKIEYQLLAFIKEPQLTQSSKQVIEDIKNQSGISLNSSLEAISCYKYDLLVQFSRIIHQLGASNISEGILLHANVLSAETFIQMQDYFENTLSALRQFYQYSQKNFTLCNQVEAYLKDNFSNPELSNMMLGDLFHISHSYLSHMYKAQKNISISDYLYKLRIDYAKELLTTTDHTLDAIAAACGFLSSSTFIKVFKKSEGVTPGAYRKLKRH